MIGRLLHIGIWLVGYVLLNLSDGTIGVFTAGTQGYWWGSLYGTFFNICLFYINSDFLLPKYLNRKYCWRYVLAIVGLYLSLSFLESYADFIFIQWYPIAYADTFKELLIENLLIHAFFVLLPSYIYRFSSDWFQNERQKQKLKEEKLAAELSFLKAQINPHFLFNTLNNLFASAQQNNDPETASGIAKLAKMMRYMLEESEAEQVSLEAELAYLKNYIDLQSIRFSEEDDIDIRLEEKGDFQGQMIAPLLLLPFVENAFKYGISLRKISFIHIEISLKHQTFFFHIQNSVHTKVQAKTSHGIGLQNVQERLKLLYPNKHKLNINTKADVFDVQLSIQL